MHTLVRYILSAVVAVAVSAVVALSADAHGLVALSLPILYGATATLVLAHRESWAHAVRTGKQDPSSRRLAAMGGGVAAFAGSFLLQVSIPVGVAGIGMMLFGSAVAVADPSVRPGGSD